MPVHAQGLPNMHCYQAGLTSFCFHSSSAKTLLNFDTFSGLKHGAPHFRSSDQLPYECCYLQLLPPTGRNLRELGIKCSSHLHSCCFRKFATLSSLPCLLGMNFFPISTGDTHLFVMWSPKHLLPPGTCIPCLPTAGSPCWFPSLTLTGIHWIR